MKKTIILFFFLFAITCGYSQYVYYGYPNVKSPMNKNDFIIINIPTFNLSGGYNFVNLEEFDILVELLEFNDTNIFRIEVNNFLGSDSIICEFISANLCNNIKEILKSKTNLKNYYLVSNGSRNPIICNKKVDVFYINANSRIEIIVE